MHPILFTIGDKITIYGYGLMIALGMIICVVVAYLRAGKRYATDPDILFNCALIGKVRQMMLIMMSRRFTSCFFSFLSSLSLDWWLLRSLCA